MINLSPFFYNIPFSKKESHNPPKINFRGLENNSTEPKVTSDNLVDNILSKIDSDTAGMQYFRNFVALKNISSTNCKKSKSQNFDYKNAIESLKKQEYYDENWLKNNLQIIAKLYNLQSVEAVDDRWINICKRELNRNKKHIIAKLENEYLAYRLEGLKNIVPELVLYSNEAMSQFAFLVAKKQKTPGLFIFAKSTNTPIKPTDFSLVKKTNARIFKLENLSDTNFESALNSLVADIKRTEHLHNKSVNLILIDNLSNIVNSNPYNQKVINRILEDFSKHYRCSKKSIAIIDFEGFDNTKVPSNKNKLGNIPFYTEEKSIIKDSFILPYLKNDSKKVTYPVLFLCGDVKKDVFDFVDSLKEEYNLPLQFVPEDTNKNEFINVLTSLINKPTVNQNKNIIFLQDLYRYLAFNKENMEFLKRAISEQKALFICTSNVPEVISSVFNVQDCLNITLKSYDKNQLVHILKKLVDRFEDDLFKKINQGKNFVPIETNFDYENIVNNLLLTKNNVGYSDLCDLVKKAKECYFLDSKKSFYQHLFDSINNEKEWK